MECDDEIKDIKGSSYDFGARIYDPRIGRWLSRDPKQIKYPHLSPYNFVANTPMIAVDPDGKDIIVVVAQANTRRMTGHMVLCLTVYKEVIVTSTDQNGEPTSTKYYTPIGYVYVQNDGGINEHGSCTSIDPITEENINKAGVVQYRFDEDGEGQKGKDISSQLEPEKIYFTEAETQAERDALIYSRDMVLGTAKGEDYDYSYHHDLDKKKGKYDANDCSTLIVDVLVFLNLVEPGFGLVSVTIDGKVYKTPTPNQIAIDSEKLGKFADIKRQEEYDYVIEGGEQLSRDLLEYKATAQ